MSAVLVAQGPRCEKIVDGERMEVIPCVAADREGEFAQLGVGFIAGNKASVWGLIMPHSLIQSWRAMKILEQVPEVFSSTLCACWYAARTEVPAHDHRYLDELARQFPSRAAFEAVRASALAAVPTTEELEAMLTTLLETSVEVSGYELTQLIEEGKLAPNPLIDRVVQEEEARRRKYDEREAIVKAPMASENSLGVFFRDLGIGNFIVGSIEWDYIELARLDEVAKRELLSGHFERFELRHTKQGPEIAEEPIGPGTPSGDIVSPRFVAADGATYTFLGVVLHEGAFLVTARVERERGNPTEGQYTVPHLRELIGPLPRQRKPKRFTRLFLFR
jgi:hypothetical protein